MSIKIFHKRFDIEILKDEAIIDLNTQNVETICPFQINNYF